MKKLILIITILISSFAFGQISVSDVIFLTDKTTIERDAITVPSGKTAILFNITTSQLELWNGISWVKLSEGDMIKAVYDPTNINSSAFDMDNMIEGTNKILTTAERTILSNTSGTNTGDQDLSALALKSNVLELDNTDIFTPTLDYHPSTKKYVDENAGGSPLTTKGDIFGYSTVDARIPIGTNDQVLTADSTQPLGLKWAASGGGGDLFIYRTIYVHVDSPSTSTYTGRNSVAVTSSLEYALNVATDDMLLIPESTLRGSLVPDFMVSDNEEIQEIKFWTVISNK